MYTMIFRQENKVITKTAPTLKFGLRAAMRLGYKWDIDIISNLTGEVVVSHERGETYVCDSIGYVV